MNQCGQVKMDTGQLCPKNTQKPAATYGCREAISSIKFFIVQKIQECYILYTIRKSSEASWLPSNENEKCSIEEIKYQAKL